jgi:hypothetical protein
MNKPLDSSDRKLHKFYIQPIKESDEELFERSLEIGGKTRVPYNKLNHWTNNN